MNDNNTENKQIEDLLRKAHLPEPSPQLHDHITAAAKKAWNQTDTELPWLIPFRRLAASAAAAIIIIWLAHYYSEYTLGQWQPFELPAASEQPAGDEVLPEIPYGRFIKRLAVINRRPSMIDASTLNDHFEALGNILDETQQGGINKPPMPSGGRSRLFSNPPNAGLYS